jgi:murein DD-endopeptidase MepM/ murein hydrolase activator NlpD
MTLTLDPPLVGQGGTLVIELQANRAVTLTGSLADRTLNFVELNGSYWALSGFPSWSSLGPQTLVLEGRSALGEVVQVTDTLTITYTQFPTEVIDIPSDREFLLDPAIIWAERQRLAAIYAEFSPGRLWGGILGYPVQSITITSGYGAIRQYDTGPGYHAGVDFDGESGDSVFAVADGRVVLAEPLQVRGGAVILDHGLGVYSNYFHLLEIAVQEGEGVSKGQIIGRMGSTGLSTGAHLHWELRVGGFAVDPFEWTRRRILP